MKIRALSSFFHPQEGARAEGRDTKRCWILMDSHRRATQTRLLRLAHAVKCRRQRSPCRRQQLRLEALPPCALLLHRVQALGSENLNRLKLVLVSAGCLERLTPDKVCHANQHAPQLLASLQSSRTSDAWQSSVHPTQSSACMQCAVASTEQVLVPSHPRSRCVSRRIHGAGA